MKFTFFLPSAPAERARDKALKLVIAERNRQINAEGWTAEHDDEHKRGDLSLAAVCYALPTHIRNGAGFGFVTITRQLWPWAMAFWKPVPHDRKRELVKAAALLLAELERELRHEAATKGRT